MSAQATSSAHPVLASVILLLAACAPVTPPEGAVSPALGPPRLVTAPPGVELGPGTVWGAAEGSLWVLTHASLFRIDLKLKEITGTIPIGGIDMAFRKGTVWIVRQDGAVLRMDLETNQAVETISVPRARTIVVADDAVWVRDFPQTTIVRIDPYSNQTVATIPVPRGSLAQVGGGAIWVSNRTDGTVSRVDPETKQTLATIRFGKPLGRVTFGEGALWVGHPSRGEAAVSRVDIQTHETVATIPFGTITPGSKFGGPVVGEGAIWVQHDGSLLGIDPRTNQVAATVPLPNWARIADIAVGEGAIWVVTRETGTTSLLQRVELPRKRSWRPSFQELI